jgi:16S rRNA processing protein RimM
LGEVSSVLSTGSNDVYVVRGPRGEVLIPAIEDVVKAVEPEAGRLIIEPIAGLFELSSWAMSGGHNSA